MDKTIIISSHIFSTLRDNCDQIHHLQNGVITRTVGRADFDDLEQEMKAYMIGDRIDKLDLK
jgi:ABC-2 type transport system ATP-binding protein